MAITQDDPTGDGELLLAARTGGREAREELARRLRRPAYLLALQLMRNREDALDVAQDAMLQLFTHLDRIDPARPLRPWIYTVVRNRAHDLWRRRKVRRSEALEGGRTDLSRHLVDEREDPERDAGRGELRRRVWRALAGLPLAKREILVLRDFHDLAYREIAEVLAIPLGTVMSRLHGARRALAAALGGVEGGENDAR